MAKIEVFKTAKSIFDINIDYFKSLGIKTIFSDMDNTLDSFKVKQPSEKVFTLVNALKNSGIELIIVSNSKTSKIAKYASVLNVKHTNRAYKPSIKIISNFIKENNIDLNSSIFIGDQIMTDVKTANKLRIKVILTNKLVKEDQLATKFNRIIEHFVLKKLRKQNKLIDWSK